jgi:pyroglutamyl-peptidase
MNDMNDSETRKDVHFIVTGFGPFRGVRDNPTTVLVTKLSNFIQDNFPTHTEMLSSLETIIIETSAEAARLETDRLKDVLSLVDGENSVVLLLHLGVNYKGTKFQLERYAYNHADFRIPDERGFQPCRKTVIEGSEPTLATNLDILQIKNNLGIDSVIVSDDPGRFVCNYTYYCSLSKFQECNHVRILFLHVPPFSVVAEQEQLEVITRILCEIRKQMIETNEVSSLAIV